MKRSKTQKSIKTALATTAGALGALLSTHAEAQVVSAPSIGSVQRVTIAGPAHGQVIEQGPPGSEPPNCDRSAKLPPVSGTLSGFNLSDFTSGNYKLYINGKKLDASRISAATLPGLLTYSESVGQPYLPLSDYITSRDGDPTRTTEGEVTSDPVRPYPWEADLDLGVDKRVRSILVEVVRADQVGNPNSYVVRDLISYIDPRKSNCGNYGFVWKDFYQEVENGFSLQFTPRHLKALAPIVREKMLPPTETDLVEGALISSAGPDGDGCKLFASLPVDVMSQFSIEAGAFILAHPTARGVKLCAKSLSTTINSIERVAPNQVSIDPSRNPLSVTLNYENVSAQAKMKIKWYFRGVNSFGIPVTSPDYDFSCNASSDLDFNFENEGLDFISRSEKVHSVAIAPMTVDSSNAGPLRMSNSFCNIDLFSTHRSRVKSGINRMAIDLYQQEFNTGYSTSNPYHSLTYAMDHAIAPLSTGKITPEGAEAGTRMRVTPTVQYFSGNPDACEEGEKGLFVMQSFRNTPNLSSLWNQWGSWESRPSEMLTEDDLADLFEARSRRVQSTCPIIRREEGRPIFDTTQAYESNLLMTTGPINQLLSAKAGERLRWTLNSVGSVEGAAMANALGMEASESLSFEIESTLPPFISPEWFYQAGHLRIRAVRSSAVSSSVEFEAASTFFLDQSVTQVLGLGVGSKVVDDLDNVLGLATDIDSSKYVSTFHAVSNGSVRPSEAQLRAAFESWIEVQLSHYLLETLGGIGSVEYAPPLVGETPFFSSVLENSITSSSASVLIPSIFRR